ncbi:MAG TPA: Rieske (2Fe-2S) protein [Rhodothermales bacterium]|nr:Rieske (2Fe-2S) protein [Rhodothermales bacterium]
MPDLPDPLAPLTAPAPLSRRGFLHGSCLIGAMLVVGAPLATALSACDSGPGEDPDPGNGNNTLPAGITISGNTVTLDLTQSGAAPLANVGGFLYIRQANTVAVNIDGTTIRAFSSTCPHEGNQVNQFSSGRLECPTHGSQFNTNGQVVRGPAVTGLTAFTVNRNGTTVTITKA